MFHTQHAILIVKRDPDTGKNYVPFDADEHPDRPAIVAAYIAALVEEGHMVEHVPHGGGSRLILHSGPRSHLAAAAQ